MKTSYHLSALLIIGTMSIFSLSCRSQDGHYWTQHYGTRSMLLNNSVIGGVEDLGAVFYNPARLGVIENPAFLLSANVYEWNRFAINDAFGESADVRKSDFGGVPSLAAGTFRLRFLEKHRFAYAVLQRQQINLNINYKNEVFGDVLDEVAGEEFFGGFIRINQKVKEEWASLAWSYPFGENFSIGLTSTFALLNQDKGNTLDLQALSESGDVAIYRYNRNFSLNSYGLLWKAGLASKLGKASWGLTLTTPVLQLGGKGDYQYEEFLSGIPDGFDEADRYTTSSQEELSSTYRSPWAVGAGISIPIGNSNLHLSSEWYSNIPRYTLLEARDHISQSSGDTLGFRLVDELENVFNFGIGTELYLNEKASFFLSFSTDFSAASSDITAFSSNQPVVTNTVFDADYYHYAGGLVLNFPGADLTLGVNYTGGTQEIARPVDFPDTEDGGDNSGIFNPNDRTNLKWTRWRLVFSFSVPFLRDYVERLKGGDE